ncbi:MAG: phytanoyl-CoA dioxygenase family protein [Lentisphaeria bacterium]|nr:phytanoyl-CoA dioxygenase family protein [Lentisphaeria bacterium]NQZ70047.1 phytanoyl-CoA dioxygenase family protein [Lentisphaeria bacterium]
MEYRADYIKNGYVIIEGAINETILAGLREAVEIIYKEIEEGKLTGFRHQTVLKPDVFHRAYIDFLNIEVYNEAIRDILDDNDPSFSGQACLIGSREHQICGWHRDFRDTDPDLPELHKIPNNCVQTNCAIYDDESLWIVPGSHVRLGSQEESDHMAKCKGLGFIDLWEKFQARDESALSGMPGSMQVKLKAGDCLLYNPLMWHAAEYKPEVKRATLHGGFKSVPLLRRFKNLRWGVQHNPWLQEPDYLGDLGPYLGPGMKHQRELALLYPDGENSS